MLMPASTIVPAATNQGQGDSMVAPPANLDSGPALEEELRSLGQQKTADGLVPPLSFL